MHRSYAAAVAVAIMLGMSAGAQADTEHPHRHAAKPAAAPRIAGAPPAVAEAPPAAPREREALRYGADDGCGLLTVGNFNSCSGSRLAPNGE